jgi:hypothetical protein
MSVHFDEVCQYGFVHRRCRCPKPQPPTVITCPPDTDAQHRAAASFTPA